MLAAFDHFLDPARSDLGHGDIEGRATVQLGSGVFMNRRASFLSCQTLCAMANTRAKR